MFDPVFIFPEPNIVHRGKLYVYSHAHGLDSFLCKCTVFTVKVRDIGDVFIMYCNDIKRCHRSYNPMSCRSFTPAAVKALWLVEDNVIEYYFRPNGIDVFKKQDASESSTVMGCRNALHCV